MNINSSASKALGKLLAVISGIILLAVIIAAWFIGGQTRAVNKCFAAMASGNYKEYIALLPSGHQEYHQHEAADYSDQCKSFFRGLPEFEALSETDVISSKIKINEHRMNGSWTEWTCTADVDFYCSGSSVSYKDVKVDLSFSSGRWYIAGTDFPNE